MRRLALVTAVALLAALPAAGSARADFGLKDLDAAFTNADGSILTQAGAHPFAYTTTIAFDTVPSQTFGSEVPDGSPKDIDIAQIAGLAGNPTATPRCTSTDFLPPADQSTGESKCPRVTQVGTAVVTLGSPSARPTPYPVYNLEPPPGVAAKLGFVALGDPVTIEVGVNPAPPYNIEAHLTEIPQALPIYRSVVTLWGVPADPSHDQERGGPAGIAPKPFLTVPRACQGPLPTVFEADSWEQPGALFSESILTHDGAAPPNPEGFTGCARLPFGPTITARPTTRAARSPSGLDFSLDVADEALGSAPGLAASDIRKAVVTLPEGMSVNPSIAEGLGVCTPAQLAAETPFSAPGQGCPEAAKVGTVEVETPLLEDQVLRGSLYVAAPYDNPFGSLLALYIVVQDPELGILIKQPARVDPDPVTGQLTTTTEEMPQLPFSHFRLHFREGTRSPLASPPSCGAHTVTALLYPWAGGPPVESTSAFQIVSGPDAGSCPSGGLPPFHPGLLAGTLNNAAGRFSPFNVRITRSDSEQEITHFSIKLPPGVAGKLAGIPFCSDAQIAQAQSRTGPHGGAEELADPSCPAASAVGRSLAGSGVGPSLAYAPGRLYLAGPYHGAPISMVAITSGVVGPFDIGTVVIRLAIDVNPQTGEVFLDSTGSDPVPHIIKGIPIHLRDIRAYTDRPEFTFNPTSCKPMSTSATLLGSGLDFGSPADDNPFVSTSRFQAADCAALTFKPKLSFRLKGGTRRGSHPSLRAHVRMRGFGEAAIARAQVTLPHSEFLEQGHIGTICTRVQFNSGTVPGENCPAASVYGTVKATTPILDGPLSGPIYLRSSEHKLPDLVAALHHAEIDVNLVGRIDSVKGKIRNTFEVVPDAPVTSADFIFGAGKKSLLVNSTDICKGKHEVLVDLQGHNGKRAKYRAPLKAKCGKKSR